MEYISIDIETTGLDREKDQVIEIGAIIENTLDPKPFEELPKFHAIIEHDRYSGSVFAINMNQRIFKILADRVLIKDDSEKMRYDHIHNVVHIENVALDFYTWCLENLTENKPIMFNNQIRTTVAGKNFASFDNPFLNNIPEWTKYFKFHHRVIDPGSMFWNPLEDKTLPDLSKCLERAGIKDTVVTHNAVLDAWQVIQAIRTKCVIE